MVNSITSPPLPRSDRARIKRSLVLVERKVRKVDFLLDEIIKEVSRFDRKSEIYPSEKKAGGDEA